MEIRAYSTEWAIEIADLFHQSVHAVDSSKYTSEQKEAWAPTPPNYERWSRLLNDKKPFVAIVNGRVVGFIELDADGHIGCTYTHPAYQGKGVASALYERLLVEAKHKGIKRLYVEASLMAKPFFERRGFAVVKENKVERNGIALVNFIMENHLYPDHQLNTDSGADAFSPVS